MNDISPVDDKQPFYHTKGGRELMEQIWKMCGYGAMHLTNPMAQQIVELIKQHEDLIAKAYGGRTNCKICPEHSNGLG